uniref:Uncharacterized protein n=1 Tax=Schizaphis graminum TaxID=13262 RepID=A0A2S2NPD6_SCHGA
MMRSLLIIWPYATFSMPNMTHGTDKCRVRLGKGQRCTSKAESVISTLSRPRQCPTNDQKTQTCVRHDTVVGSGGGAKGDGNDSVVRTRWQCVRLYNKLTFYVVGARWKRARSHTVACCCNCHRTSYYFTFLQ